MSFNYHIQRYIDIVESGEHPTSKEVKALVKHVKYCFENEDIYINEEQADRYISLGRYFPFDEIFPWQDFIITLHDCTYWADSDMPRWPDLFCMTGRGSGKDGMIALEAVALSSQYNGVNHYDVDICANNEEQAIRPVCDVIEAFEQPAYVKKLRHYYHWTKEQVANLKTKAVINGRTNNPKGKDGLRSGIVVFNEIHQYEDYKNINVFTTGLGKVAHPRRSYYTTQGDVREGPLDDLLETSEGILFGGDPDNGLLPFICRLDDKKEVDDESCWVKANPSLPYMPSLMTETRKEYREWKKNPNRLPAFMTKRMNVPDGNAEIQVTDYENIKSTNTEIPDLTGWSCVCGIDYSKLTDFVSADLHFRDGDKRYDINHTWVCTHSNDLPRIKAPLKEWESRGRITYVDDVEISPAYVTDWIQNMKKIYTIKGVAIDDFRFALLSKALLEIGFDMKSRKNLKMVRPSDIMKVSPVVDSCFVNHNFVWGDAPELRWAANNTKLIPYGRNTGDDIGNFVYGKIEAKSRKTDPFLALVAAMTIEDMLGPKRQIIDLDVATF